MATGVNTEANHLSSSGNAEIPTCVNINDGSNISSNLHDNVQKSREISQMDHLNKKLLSSYLDRLNNDETNQNQILEMECLDEEGSVRDGFTVERGPVTVIPGASIDGSLIGAKMTLTVGISGCTNSGKSTLVEHLNDLFVGQAVVINQDRYFLAPDNDKLPLMPDVNHKNWETLDALETDRMLDDLKRLIVSPEAERPSSVTRIVLIDGFLLYNHPELRDLCDLKFYLEVPEEVCKHRRLGRAYDPPDVPGYVDKYVWPTYLKHRAEVELLPDVRYLDGTASVQELANIVLNGIRRYVVGV